MRRPEGPFYNPLVKGERRERGKRERERPFRWCQSTQRGRKVDDSDTALLCSASSSLLFLFFFTFSLLLLVFFSSLFLSSFLFFFFLFFLFSSHKKKCERQTSSLFQERPHKQRHIRNNTKFWGSFGLQADSHVKVQLPRPLLESDLISFSAQNRVCQNLPSFDFVDGKGNPSNHCAGQDPHDGENSGVVETLSEDLEGSHSGKLRGGERNQSGGRFVCFPWLGWSCDGRRLRWKKM